MSVMYSVWLNKNYFVLVIILIITCIFLFFFKGKIRIFGEWNPADREQVYLVF